MGVLHQKRQSPELTAEAVQIARDFLQGRLRSHRTGPCGLNVNEEQELAEEVMAQLMPILSGTAPDETKPVADGDYAIRFAALGLSAADLVEWIRGLESVVTDRYLASADLDQQALRVGVARINAWFNQLCSRQLDAYESAQGELVGRYSRVGTDLMSYLTSGAIIDPSVVKHQARTLGIDPRQPFRAVAVRGEAGLTPLQKGQIQRRLIRVFRRFAGRGTLLMREQGDVLLCLVPIAVDNSTLVGELGELLADEELRRTLYVAVGEPVEQLPSAGRSCRQALSALEIATYREYRGRVTKCTEVILEVLLSHNPWVSEKIVESRLSAIVDKPNLVETLRAYIDCDMSLQRTAEELFVHPNTVAYRVRQIGARTGRDMRRITDLAELSAAMAALDVIRMQADTQRELTEAHEEFWT